MFVAVIVRYLEYVSKLKYDQVPDYDFCRKLFKEELKKIGEPKSGKLVFKVDNKTPKKAAKKPSAGTRKRTVANGYKSEEDEKDRDCSEEEKCLPTTPKRSARKLKDKEGPSWKDSETVKASGVTRAGEYVSNHPKHTKRQKKL